MSNPFFHFKQFSILSQEKGLKVTTDACLLGAIAQAQGSETLLDIGTGTGVVALLMAQRYPDLRIDAIDIETAIVEQALINVANSPFHKQIAILEADFLKWHTDTRYDTIVSNPPYFDKHLKKQASEKNTAIHAEQMNHQLMITKVASLLSRHGHFYCILPPYEMGKLIIMAENEGLYPIEKTNVFNQPDKHYRDIVCFSFNKSTTKHAELLLVDQEGKKTVEFHRLMADFYLENTSKYRNNQQ